MRHFTIVRAILPIFALAIVTPVVSQDNLSIPYGWSRSSSGSNIILSESNGEARLTIKKLVPFGISLSSWFNTQVERDAQTRGELYSSAPLKQRGSILSMTRKYRVSGRPQSVAYIGYSAGRQGRFFIFSAPSDSELANGVRSLQSYVRQLSNYDNEAAQRSSVASTTLPRVMNKPPQPIRSTPSKTPSGPIKTFNRGTLKSTQIVGLFLNESYGVGVGGSMTIEYEPVLLLRDGSARRNLAIPPLDIVLAKDKVTYKKDWGRWARSAGKFVVHWGSGSKDELKPNFKVLAGRSGETLQGRYSTIGGGGNTALGGDVMVYYSKAYNFGRDSRFLSDSSGGGGTSSVTSLSTSKNAGRYRIDGYTLTFQFNDGRQVRRLFYFYPDGKRGDVIGIGDSAYTHDD